MGIDFLFPDSLKVNYGYLRVCFEFWDQCSLKSKETMRAPSQIQKTP